MRYIIYYRQNVDNILAWKETPGIPVTGYIIGDQPKTWIGIYAKTLIIRKEGLKKQTQLTGWTFDFIRKYESYSTGEEKDFD